MFDLHSAEHLPVVFEALGCPAFRRSMQGFPPNDT
jgi:hypothetical protein